MYSHLSLRGFLLLTLFFHDSTEFRTTHIDDFENEMSTTSGLDDTSDVTETVSQPSVDTDEVAPAPLPEETPEDFVYRGCGKSSFSHELSNRVRGGEDAEQKDWPWHAQMNMVMVTTEKNNSLVMKKTDTCGASLINKYWALTAAHCVHREGRRNKPVEQQFYLTFGDRKSANSTVVRSAKQTFVHPYYEYEISQAKFDVALVLLNESVKFTSKILPVCLPEVDLDLSGHTVYLTGRGIKVDKDGNMSRDATLQQVEMKILKNSECLDLMPENDETCPHCQEILKPTDSMMLCAGLPDGSVSATHGDSGGPLVLRQYDGTWTQVGAVSTGHPDYIFGIFTKISKHLWWINKIVKAHSPSEGFDDDGY